MTDVLMIGSGGREAAIVEKLCEDSTVERVFCSPGSGGIQAISSKVGLFPGPTGPGDYKELIAFAKRQQVSLTIVGPEVPLVDGIVNAFSQAGLRIVGPTMDGARLEGSKVFCKNLLRDDGIPTADYEIFDDPRSASQYIRKHGVPIVVKADGLAAGKGVIVAHTEEVAIEAVNQIMVRHQFGENAGRKVVVEEFLQGQECSVMALTDGEMVMPFPPVQDYKPVFDDDKGPNTGGMGCYAPVPACTLEIRQEVIDRILYPTVKAMKKAGCSYRGVLYAGLMLTTDGPKVMEFNCRFGDPEVQVLLALMKPSISLLSLLEATVEDRLDTLPSIEEGSWQDRKAICVVLATHGYPGSYPKGLVIEGIEQAEAKGISVIHAGTKRAADGRGWVTDGGRVLHLVAIGDTGGTFSEVRDHVYAGVECIKFGGKPPHFRTDIARRAC